MFEQEHVNGNFLVVLKVSLPYHLILSMRISFLVFMMIVLFAYSFVNLII